MPIPSESSTPAPSSKLSLGPLTALVVGSMIGSGIFNLPQNMAVNAGAAAILIGWLITGIGMLMLCLVYQTLAMRKPNLDNGIYAYARASAGEFIGFSAAWGYWFATCLGNISFLVALFGALGYFFPIFGEGNTRVAILSASFLLWIMHAFILRGIKGAAVLNIVITLAKALPLLLFIIVTFIAFHLSIFRANFWGHPTSHSVLMQVKNTMLVTVWVFIGIESASVYSARTKRRQDIGKATILGFLITLLLLMSVSLLSLGILLQTDLALLKNLSMASVLEKVTGRWGAIVIVFGLLLSVGGAILAWTLLAAEVLFVPAKEGLMPRFLMKENAREVPANALWLTNGLIQLFLIITLFSQATYMQLIALTTSMSLVPYLFSAVYASKLAFQRENYVKQQGLCYRDCSVGIVTTAYCCWLLYAAGLKYLLLSALLYTPGVIFYTVAKRQQNKTMFLPFERVILIGLLVLAGIATYSLARGKLSL